jgi:hypothetical protein
MTAMAFKNKDETAPFDLEQESAPTADAETGEITSDQASNMITDAFKGANVVFAEKDDPMSVQRDIVKRVMSADSMDELFGNWEVTTSDKLEGKTIFITEAEFTTYESEDGPIPLARVKGNERPSDEPITFVTTAPNLTSFIARAQQLNGLPFTAKIVGNKTSRGFTALHFERVK